MLFVRLQHSVGLGREERRGPIRACAIFLEFFVILAVRALRGSLKVFIILVRACAIVFGSVAVRALAR